MLFRSTICITPLNVLVTICITPLNVLVTICITPLNVLVTICITPLIVLVTICITPLNVLVKLSFLDTITFIINLLHRDQQYQASCHLNLCVSDMSHMCDTPLTNVCHFMYFMDQIRR